MEHKTISEALALEEEQEKIVLKGWVKTIRVSKNVAFIALNDGSTMNNMQIVLEPEMKGYEELTKEINTGSSLKVTGKLIDSPGKGQKFEVNAKDIEIYGTTTDEYPLQKKDLPLEFLRDNAHFRPRTNTFQAVFRMRSKLAKFVHDFFCDKGFMYVHTPIITASDAEGAGEMFKVTTLDLENIPKTKKGKVDYDKDFFAKPSFLTVSGQLNGELFALGNGLIYTFGPTFRAENSNTVRHISEFWMIEPEMAFFDVNDLMDIEEEFVRYMAKRVLDECSDELTFLNNKIDFKLKKRIEDLLKHKFERVRYEDAIKILEEAVSKNKVKFEINPTIKVEIGSEHERYLTEKHYKKPMILYDFPKEFKAFYMYHNDDKKTVRGTDVLVPYVGEIIGGSEREWRHDKLIERIKELDLDEKDYAWYLQTRKQGTVPHAGFGLGFERIVMMFTGMKNIRDVSAFPRTPRNADF